MPHSTPPPLFEAFAATFVLFSVVCAAWVIGDVLRRPQKMWIMGVVWPLTALYAGPFGLWAYLTIARPPAGSDAGREEGEKPMWRSTLLGATHCGAGCTVGDFIGDWAVFLGGLTLAGSDLYAKFLAAFVLAYGFGVFFQYFAIAPMRNLGLREGLWAAIKADTLSLAAYEVGMFAGMAITQKLLFPGLEPTRWTYWFMMQIAMLLGLATTYPVNWWLIRKGLKEAM